MQAPRSPAFVFRIYLRYYVGAPARLDAVLAIDKDRTAHVFDVAVHLRTLALIEDNAARGHQHKPVNGKEKAKEYVASPAFDAMVRCLAEKVRQTTVHRPDVLRRRSLQIYLATDAADVRSELAQRLEAATSTLLNMHNVGTPWKVEVDYLSPTLEPANYWAWTYATSSLREVSH